MRAAYAEAAAEYLTFDGTYTATAGSNVSSITEASGVVTITVTGVNLETQQGNNWSDLAGELPFTCFTDPGAPVDNGTATFTYTTSTGAWALTGVAAASGGGGTP